MILRANVKGIKTFREFLIKMSKIVKIVMRWAQEKYCEKMTSHSFGMIRVTPSLFLFLLTLG